MDIETVGYRVGSVKIQPPIFALTDNPDNLEPARELGLDIAPVCLQSVAEDLKAQLSISQEVVKRNERLIAEMQEWIDGFEVLLETKSPFFPRVIFACGEWWADRPWRKDRS